VIDIPSRSRRPAEGRYLEELCPSSSDAAVAAAVIEDVAAKMPFGIATDPEHPWRGPGRDPEYKQVELCDMDDVRILLERARDYLNEED
jgi:hypothetical protein